mgnify:CR=1 FL=1
MTKNIIRLMVSIVIISIVVISGQIYSFNNRQADNLSSYCNIDFIGLNIRIRFWFRYGSRHRASQAPLARHR